MSDPIATLATEVARDGRMHATLTPVAQGSLAGATVCFSLLSPVALHDGAALTRSEGGYAEITLPDTLTPGASARWSMSYAFERHGPLNITWGPMGAYLRLPDGQLGDISTQPMTFPHVIAKQHPVVEPDTDTGLGLIPEPQHWAPDQGLLAASHGFALAPDAPFAEVTTQVEALAGRTGLLPFLRQNGIPLSITLDTSRPDEGYRLTISPQKVEIAAASANGARYGAISLLLLARLHPNGIPCGTITDAPRFAWRGQHLDCARHFFRPETIARLLDLMALFKLNRLHWHFNDDEAFRLEVTCHPDIWQRSAFRGEGLDIPGVFGGGKGPTGGSYSLDDARELISHGQALGIEIMPEIEVPAHALALARIKPGLRDPNDTGQETSVQGYARNSINPACDATWPFLDALSAELLDIFPFRHLHIGGDEPPAGMWDASPAVDALKAREGLDDREDAQGWTMDKLAGIITGKGGVPAAWEEAARGSQGGIGNDAILFSWSGQGPGLEAARAGYRVVLCPAQNTYWDMSYCDDPSEPGLNWAAFINLADTLNWTPVPPNEPELEQNIIGLQGAFWSETITEDNQVEPRIAPRILGLAEMAWTHPETTPKPPLLYAKTNAHRPIFAAMGWQMRPDF